MSLNDDCLYFRCEHQTLPNSSQRACLKRSHRIICIIAHKYQRRVLWVTFWELKPPTKYKEETFYSRIWIKSRNYQDQVARDFSSILHIFYRKLNNHGWHVFKNNDITSYIWLLIVQKRTENQLRTLSITANHSNCQKAHTKQHCHNFLTLTQLNCSMTRSS